MQPILVSTTCATKEDAATLSETVLNRRLAACVQISGPVMSRYRWQGAVVEEPEYVVTMKTRASLFEDLVAAVQTVHRYEVPEIIATEITSISDNYRAWLLSELS